jgi:hypothetical protein
VHTGFFCTLFFGADVHAKHAWQRKLRGRKRLVGREVQR